MAVLVAFSIVTLLTGSLLGQPRTKIRPETAEAFDSYVQSVETSLDLHAPRIPEKWLGHGVDPDSKQVTIEKKVSPKIPAGIIHDWRGAVLVEGVTPDQVASALTDYESHSGIYPEVEESRVLSSSGDELRSFLRLRKTNVLTVVLDTEHIVEKRRIRPGHWLIESRSTRIQEVRDAGKAGEKQLPVGHDSGFLWRLNAYWNLTKVEGGTLVECVTISLSRAIPTGLGWIIRPFVNRMPKQSLEATLLATRRAVLRSN